MFIKTKKLVDALGYNPYRIPYDPVNYIDLASNNYLGLAGHPKVKQSTIDATVQYGVSGCGTPVASGYSRLYQAVSKRLAQFVGLQDSLLFASCYQANNGIFATLCAKDDYIIFDKYAHSSLIEGIRVVGCRISPFLHNDMDHLEKMLKRLHGYRKVFVVTESVFSTEGSIAPLDKIVALCDKYGAVPLVDDSHGIGVLGEHGGGVLEHFKIDNYKGLYTASLGKAVGNMGGMVAGDKDIMEYLSYFCPQLVYSTALTPPILGGLDAALSVIENDFSVLAKRMWKYKGIISAAIDCENTPAPITPIFCGSIEKTIELSAKLYKKGILSTPFVEPSVPKNKGVVRIIAGAALEEDKVIWAAEQIKAIISS